MNKDIRKQLGIDENKPNDWFETLYANVDESGKGVPWANMAPHPVFQQWMDKTPQDGAGKKALVVGCGMGDDALALEARGFEVTAFDVSKSAIDLCNNRFPNAATSFVTADLLAGIPEWNERFDFVLEIYTVQALPPKFEEVAIKNIADFVAQGGELLVVTEVQNAKRVFEVGPPWLLNPSYVDSFEHCGLKMVYQEDNHHTSKGDAQHLTLFQKLQP